MRQHLLLAAFACVLASACSSAPAATPDRDALPVDPLGRTAFYVRSNQDGTMAERIIVHRQTRTRVAVSKQVENCTNAAYVTADLDLSRGEASALTGGRLTRQSTQEAFATITADLNDRTLDISVPTANVEERLTGIGAPWRIYDFDLADISALMEGRPAPRDDFGFFVALAWPDTTEGPFVTNRGQADADFVREEERQGRGAVLYNVTGALNGQLWLDAREGYVVEARFNEPNHPGYTNFALVLQRVVNGPEGEAAWRDALAAHWQGC